MATDLPQSSKHHSFPPAVEGPRIPYKNKPESNPVLRGTMLEIGASLVYYSGLLQGVFWRNAGFNAIRDIDDLQKYEPRYDPTVYPSEPTKKPGAGGENVDVATGLAASAVPKDSDAKKGYYTSLDYHELYKSGKLTPTMVAEALLPLIRRDTKPPGEHSIAFLDSKIDIIHSSAEASTARYKSGNPLGPLDGVPVAVKDEADVAGYTRTLGSKMDFTDKSGETSWCVKQWEEAGAIVIGKATMHEVGLDTTNNNPIVGTPRNPHNPDFYTGGSSGGSGYAVSAGIVPVALGADGGGSIRLPSNYCGIYGLKTTHGRISGAPTIGLATTVGVYGPMAASLDDLALSYRIMANPDPTHPTSANFPSPLSTIQTPQSSSRPKVIGIYHDWLDRSDPNVKALFNKTMDYYRKEKGYTTIDISIPYLPEGQKSHALVILCEIAAGLSRQQTGNLSAPNKILLSVGGTQATAQDLIAAQKMRNLLMCHLSHLYQKHPGLIIATPTTPMAGAKITMGEADLTNGVSDTNSTIRSMEYVYLANFTGCPAISSPMGYTDDTLMPVGIMGMGEWGCEEALIQWARDGEGVLGQDETAAGGLRMPDTTKRGKWVDAVKLARESSD